MKALLWPFVAWLAVLAPPTARAEFKPAPDALGLLDLDLIQKIEAKVEMPTGTRPIAEYSRYYTTIRESAKVVVVGVFTLRSGDPGAHIVSPEEQERHVFMDGGCALVMVWFDLASQSMIGAACNGVA